MSNIRIKAAAIVLTIVFCGLVKVGSCQTPSISQVLVGGGPTLTIKFKDMDATWSSLSLSPTARSPYPVLYSRQTGDGRYYTHGDKLTVGSDSFLIAYELDKDYTSIANVFGLNGTVNPPTLTKETKLNLTLVNLSEASGLYDVQPLDPAQMIVANNALLETIKSFWSTAGTPAPHHTDDDDRLKQIGAAVASYAKAHDGHLPPLENAVSADKALRPYAGSTKIFNQVDENLPFVPNPSLSGRKISQIKNPAGVIIFYGSKPDSCGCHHALFADGSAHEIFPNDWKKVKKASGISD